MDGILITNLDEIVKNPEVTSVIQKSDRWGIMSYETGDFFGKGLVAADFGHPADVILQPKVAGWHKVYIASPRLNRGIWLTVRFDNEENFTHIKNSAFPPLSGWHPGESFEELFWFIDRHFMHAGRGDFTDVPVRAVSTVTLPADGITAMTPKMQM